MLRVLLTLLLVVVSLLPGDSTAVAIQDGLSDIHEDVSVEQVEGSKDKGCCPPCPDDETEDDCCADDCGDGCGICCTAASAALVGPQTPYSDSRVGLCVLLTPRVPPKAAPMATGPPPTPPPID